jgi:hypothetical protein
MGWLPVLLSVIAAILFYGIGHTILMILAIVVGLGCFWSWGRMHNYAKNLAVRRPDCSGRFYDITDAEADAVPDWIAGVNMGFCFLALTLLLAAIALSKGLRMTWWLNWLILLVGSGFVFMVWSWIPTERLDKYWRWNNPVGRPLLNTLVITGLPALYAKLMETPWPILLIPISFVLTQHAVLSGRFLTREFGVAGWVMVITTVAIWLAFFIT